MWVPLAKPDIWDSDPPPGTPAPPNPGESHEDYSRRCGPFVMINGRYYQESYINWLRRYWERQDDKKAREPKAIYTLHPRSGIPDAIMSLIALAFIAAAFYLAFVA